MVRKVDCFEDIFAKVMQGLVRYPCPLAEQHHCTETFSSKASADRHKSKHSGIRYPCPLAEQYQNKAHPHAILRLKTNSLKS